MKNIRVLLGYCPVYGKDLANELVQSPHVSLCYNATGHYCCEEQDSKIINFNNTLGKAATYDKVFDLNQIPALSKEIMEKMLPYESMAIKLGIRRTNFPIASYEEEKRKYYKHLRFWNYILDKYKINAVFFEEFPHTQYTYVIYALARVRKIPLMLCNNTSIAGIRVYGSSIEDAGNNISEFYESVAKKMDVDDCVLTGEVEKFFNKYRSDIKDLRTERQKNDFEKKELERIKNYLYGAYFDKKSFLKPLKKKIHYINLVLNGKHDWNWYHKNKKDILEIMKERYDIRFYLKNMAMSQKKYNTIAEKPDYSKKYIYFGLQLTPEETTIPRAGVFAEQYTSIQLLARAAKKAGVFVYVKEHFVQPFRNRAEYEMLREIPNVKLIKTTESSFELMKHSIAVATQTGTCILEGALQGKPAVVTSGGYFWKGIPSLFEIVDEEQGADVIKQLLEGFRVEESEIRKYFYSIQQSSVECYLQADYMHQQDRTEHKESAKRLIALLHDFFMTIE